MEKKPAPFLQRQQKQQLFERKKKRGRKEKTRKGHDAQAVCRVKGAGTCDGGGPAGKRTVTRERCAREEAVLPG